MKRAISIPNTALLKIKAATKDAVVADLTFSDLGNFFDKFQRKEL